MKFLQSTTDTILLVLTIALVGFTAKGITDPKDFYAFVGMIASYKFGKVQQTKDIVKTQEVSKLDPSLG